MATAPEAEKQVDPVHPLRTKAFLLVWAGLAVSVLGDQFYRVALTLTAADRGPFGLATLGIALALPIAVVGLFAGVFIDRHDRLRLLVHTDVVRCAIVAVLGFLLLGGYDSFPALIALAALLSFVSVVFTPALQALLPSLAGNDTRRLIAMDAWILGAVSVAGMVGPALGGLLLQTMSPGTLMLVDAVTFAFSAVMILLAGRELPNRERPAPGLPARGKVHAVGEGLRFLMKHPVLGPCFRTFPLMDFALNSVPFVLPLLLAATTDESAGHYGLMLGALAVGRVAGMALLNKTALKQHRGAVLRYNFLVQGAGVLSVALVGDGWAGLPLMAIVGLPAGAAQVAMASYVQLEVEPHMRGRVFAALTSMVTWLAPLGPVVFVAVAGFVSPAAAMAAIALLLAAGGLRLFFCRPLKLVA